MSHFRLTTHLSQIVEDSHTESVIIFIHSADCNGSGRVYDEIKRRLEEKRLIVPIYLVTVQEMPVLSKKIEDFFDIKHESPQVLILNKGKVVYTAHHDAININNFVFE